MIVLSVNPPYAGWLVDGIKEIEWRKRFLPRGKVLIYETKKHGGIGAVIGEVEIVGEYWCVAKEITLDDISREFLLAYANGEEMIAANCAKNGIRYKEPRPLSDFYVFKKCHACDSGYESTGCKYDAKCMVPVPLTRPPQSWCRVWELN